MSPRRSVIASLAAGCSLAAAVVAGGYAAGGAMPFSDWPGEVLGSDAAAQVALAPARREAAPVVTLRAPAGGRERTQVIPLPEADAPAASSPAATSRPPARRTTARRLTDTSSRAPVTNDDEAREPDASPAPAAATPAPAAVAASPAAQAGPVQAAAPTTRRVKLSTATATFASARTSGSGQPELKVQMAVAGASTAVESQTVALSLKLAPTDVRALLRSAALAGSSPLALETEVDVVDATVTTAGTPACADGTCLRVQMKFAEDTREQPADEPEVQVLEDGDAISNRVKVVVPIDASDLGAPPASPPAAPAPGTPDDTAPDAGAPAVISLPLAPAAADPSAPPSAPAEETTTVTLPDGDPATPAPEAPAVQVKAQLEVLDAPAPEAPAVTAAAEAPAAQTTPAPAPAPAPSDPCR